MPTINSVCIGCQWEQLDYTLLTAPSNDIFLVHPDTNSNNTFKLDDVQITLTLHGCGVKMNNSKDRIEYVDRGMIEISDSIFKLGTNVDIGVDVSVRTKGMEDNELDKHILNILTKCPGTIYGRLKQRYAKTKYGDFEYVIEDNLNNNQNFIYKI